MRKSDDRAGEARRLYPLNQDAVIFPRMSLEKQEPLGVMVVREAIRWESFVDQGLITNKCVADHVAHSLGSLIVTLDAVSSRAASGANHPLVLVHCTGNITSSHHSYACETCSTPYSRNTRTDCSFLSITSLSQPQSADHAGEPQGTRGASLVLGF